MRWLTWALLLALLAATAALVLQFNAGNVAFLVPPYRIDVSLNLLLIALLLVLAFVYWIARAMQKLADFPEQVRIYRTRREEIGSQQALVEAVRSFLEGRFARAEKSARAAQSSPATAAVAALIGARSAHRMHEYDRRDDWLAKAEGDPRAATAKLVSSAEMWTEQRANEPALEAINRLQASGARHIHAMRIALNANIQSGRWADALKTLRALEKRGAVHPTLARKLKLTIYCEQLSAQRYDVTSLEAAWKALPADDRVIPEIALEGARLLNVAGRGGRAAEVIEAALRSPPSDWDESSQRLIDEYAKAQSFPARLQLERVEQWLAAAPRDGTVRAALLRTAGLLCLREQLWGKSKAYLLESLETRAEPSTFLALARLAEAIGEELEATTYYREAAIAYSNAQAAPSSADSPALLPRLGRVGAS